MKLAKVAAIGLLALLTMSCATSNIPARESIDSTLLLLPFSVENRAQHGAGKLGYHCDYEIVSVDNSVEPINVFFDQWAKLGSIVVDSLPPGQYRLESFGLNPAGGGNKGDPGDRIPLGYGFELKAGEATVFPFSLNIEIYNPTAARSMERIFSPRIDALTEDQREELLKELGKQENLADWTVI